MDGIARPTEWAIRNEADAMLITVSKHVIRVSVMKMETVLNTSDGCDLLDTLTLAHSNIR